MKKKFVLILAALMCISLCACGGAESTSGNNNSESNSSQITQNESNNNETTKDTEITEGNKPVEGKDYAVSEDGIIAISKKYCAENMLLVEITPDNWKDYFQVVEETIGTEDGFGEVTYTTRTVAKPYLEGKYVYGFYNQNNPDKAGAFEFKNLKTGETVAGINRYEEQGTDVVYTLDDFELVRASATLMLLNIPDELWNKQDNGIEFVHIGKPTDPFPFTYQNGEEVDYYIVEDIIKESK